MGCSRPNLVVLHSNSDRLEKTIGSKKHTRRLDKLVSRKSTRLLKNSSVPVSEIFFKNYWWKYVGDFVALSVDCSKIILALETIQLKWSQSTNRFIVSFSSYFVLGHRDSERSSLRLASLVILEHTFFMFNVKKQLPFSKPHGFTFDKQYIGQTKVSRKLWRGLDKLVSRKSTCCGENIFPHFWT